MAKRKPKRQPKAKANKTRRGLITGGVVYVADKAAGGVIGKAAVTVLSKLAPAASGTVVTATGIAVGAAYVVATGEAVMQGHPPHVMVSGPDGVGARDRDCGASPLALP